MTQPNLEVVGVRAVVQGFDAYIRQIGAVERSTKKTATGLAQAGRRASTAGASFRRFGASAGAMASGLLGVQVGLASVRALFGGTVGAAIAFESSFAGVRKTVDATEEQFAQLEEGFRGLARAIPISVFEINRLGEAAGQLGIETDNIVEFTRTMAQLGATTNLSAEEAAVALARLANITRLPQDQFDELGSTIVELGNNFATTEREIVELSLRLAAAGSQIGLTQAEILGFATALSSLGVRAEAGGTAFSRMFVEIEKAVRGGGEDLAAFAEVAGLTAEEFVQAYQQDAAGAITTFIEGLGDIGEAGGNVFGVLERLELDNVRVRDALLRTAGGADILRRSLDTGKTAWEENTALAEEFGKRVETTGAQLQIARNRITDVGIDLGTALLPVLVDAAMFTADWVERLELLAPLLPTIATAVGALVAVLAVQRIIAFARGIDTFGKAAKGLVTGNAPLLILVGAVTALDVALRAITGKGIIGTLSKLFEGNQTAAEGAARAVREYELALLEAGPGADEAAVAGQLFAESVEEQNRVLARLRVLVIETTERTKEESREVSNLAKRRRELKGVLEEQFQTMVDAGVATMDLVAAFQALTPEQQQLITDTGVMEGVWAAYRGEVERGDAALANIRIRVDAAAEALEASGDAIEDETDTFAEYIDTLDEAADANKELARVISLLTDSLINNNPEVIAARAAIAEMNIRIAEIDASTGELTQTQVEQREEWVLMRDEAEKVIDVIEANADALEPYIANIARLTGTGTGTLSELAANLVEVGLGADPLEDIFRNVQRALEDVDSQGAIDALLAIKAVADDEEFQAIGISVLNAIAAGLTDPTAIFQLFLAGEAMGLSVTAGFNSGMVDFGELPPGFFAEQEGIAGAGGGAPAANPLSVPSGGAANFRPINFSSVQGPGAGDAAAPRAITNDISIDISGSSFTGTAEENADAIAAAVRDILGDEQTVGAFQAGVG